MPAGYSGTPLPKKLGIKAPMELVVLGAPTDYESMLGDLPRGVRLGAVAGRSTSRVHVFATRRAELSEQLVLLRKTLGDETALWVS